MSDYWLGVVTTPALVLALFVLLLAWARTIVALERRGITFEAKYRRGAGSISEYTLRHDIWWERQFGPIFVGGWYREKSAYEAPSHRLFTRWVGLGSADGPCLTVFRLRDLGEVEAA